MARNLTLSRTEAEWLVDLLEEADPKAVGTWRVDMAAEVRQLFGMCSLEQERINLAFIKDAPIRTIELNIHTYPDAAK